jgi:hypothetical protein
MSCASVRTTPSRRFSPRPTVAIERTSSYSTGVPSEKVGTTVFSRPLVNAAPMMYSTSFSDPRARLMNVCRRMPKRSSACAASSLKGSRLSCMRNSTRLPASDFSSLSMETSS